MSISILSTKTIKDAVRAAIGHEATFTIVSSGTSPCPNCSVSGWYDSYNDKSLYPWCGICSGDYWLDGESQITVSGAHVRWITMDTPGYGPAGQTYEGDCYVTISIDDLTTTQVNNVKEIEVDSRKVQPFKTIYRGIPSRDRIRFMCREFEKV